MVKEVAVMARKNRAGHQPVANPGLARAMRELRRSSAAQPHTPRPRKGTRGARKRSVIAEQVGA